VYNKRNGDKEGLSLLLLQNRTGIKVLAFLCCLLLFAAPAAAQETDFHWEMQLLHWETAASLEATEAITTYEGDINTAVHTDAPAEGCVYLLVKLSIAKTAAGGEGFQWDKLYAQDAQGSRYARMDNDTFLETYGFRRLPATEIRIGNKTGFIAFEVPIDAAQDEFTFWYALTQDEIIPVTFAAQDADAQ